MRRHRIENGALDGWDITIDRKVPEAGTEDMAQWHLFLEVQMGDVIKATDKVRINGKQSARPPAISGLVGISRTPSISAYQDPWGVKLTAKNITPSGLTIVCTQHDGEPTGELQTGSYYTSAATGTSPAHNATTLVSGTTTTATAVKIHYIAVEYGGER